MELEPEVSIYSDDYREDSLKVYAWLLLGVSSAFLTIFLLCFYFYNYVQDNSLILLVWALCLLAPITILLIFTIIMLSIKIFKYCKYRPRPTNREDIKLMTYKINENTN